MHSLILLIATRRSDDCCMLCTNNPSLFTRLDILPKKIVWLLDRSIKLSKFRMRGAVPEDIALKYLQEFGRCIQSVSTSLGINAEFIKAVATHSPNVIEVDVETTDGALSDTLREFRRQLRTLDLHTCSTAYAAVLTSVGLYAIINGCPLLQKISIHPHWDTSSFAEVLRTHPQLFSRTRVRDFDVMKMF